MQDKYPLPSHVDLLYVAPAPPPLDMGRSMVVYAFALDYLAGLFPGCAHDLEAHKRLMHGCLQSAIADVSRYTPDELAEAIKILQVHFN